MTATKARHLLGHSKAKSVHLILLCTAPHEAPVSSYGFATDPSTAFAMGVSGRVRKTNWVVTELVGGGKGLRHAFY